MSNPPKKSLFHLLSQIEVVSEDLKEWTRLRLELGKYQTEETINKTISIVLVIGIGLMALFFAMVSLALALGMLLGNLLWGFLATTGLLLLLILLLFVLRPQFWRYKQEHEFWNNGAVGAFLNPKSSEEAPKLKDSKEAKKEADNKENTSDQQPPKQLNPHGK